jgi:flagellin
MVINTNLQAQIASTRLSESSSMLAQSLSRLSSGSRITTPADDGAGLAEAMQLGAKMKRLDAVANNLSNALSFTQTQDGYLSKINGALTRMSELSVMAQDITKTDSDRTLYDTEFNTLGRAIQDMAGKTFNGVSLFSGNALQVTNDAEGNTFSMAGVDLASMSFATVLADHVNVIGNGGTGAVYAEHDLDRVISALATARANLGSNIESLNYYLDQNTTLKNTLSAANSRITDVDVAQESTRFAKYNILVQSGTAMLAQANSAPQSVLKLLG